MSKFNAIKLSIEKKFKYEKIITEKTIVKSCHESGNSRLLISKHHPCALAWNDRCAYCEFGYDEFKKLLSCDDETSKDALLHDKIDECIATIGLSF